MKTEYQFYTHYHFCYLLSISSVNLYTSLMLTYFILLLHFLLSVIVSILRFPNTKSKFSSLSNLVTTSILYLPAGLTYKCMHSHLQKLNTNSVAWSDSDSSCSSAVMASLFKMLILQYLKSAICCWIFPTFSLTKFSWSSIASCSILPDFLSFAKY